MRLKLFALREAAGVVLLGQPTTASSSSPTWACNNRAAIAGLRRAISHSSLSILRPQHCCKWAPFYHHCPDPQPISAVASFRCLLDKHPYSTAVARKALKKHAFGSKSKSRSPGKPQKQGSTRRPFTIAATSRHNASFGEGRNNMPLFSTLQKGGAPTRTAVQRQERSESQSHSDLGRSWSRQNQTQIKKLRSTEAASVSLSRKASMAIENLKNSSRDKKETGKLSSQEVGPQKKGKRVMRLDPKDTTSKRHFEGYPLPGEEVQEEAPAALSGREQFRQIEPLPKLLQHIEKHMLGRRRPSALQKAGYDMRITPAPLDNIPYSKKGERQPIQEEVFRHKLRFAAAAKSDASLPPFDLPEVAFAGRSNVGKSSLINALTRQWGVARTSDKPGQTQSINFFRLGGRLCLVDLPGYGFACAAEEKKEAWEEFVKEFVQTRAGLKRVYVLVDAKWGLKLKDEELVQLMEKAGTKYQIVLTKSDTVTPMDLARRATQIHDIFKGNKLLMLPMIMVSSRTGEGLEFCRGHVARLANASLI